MSDMDFKAALEWHNKVNWDERTPEVHAVRTALRIADRLQSIVDDDELISTKMEYAGSNTEGSYGDMFKTMAAQMIKEEQGDD